MFVSHGLGQVEQLCQDVAWIEKGELRMLGPAADVISAYQGDSHQAERVEGEQGSRWGSGEAQIVGVSLRDSHRLGHPCAHDARAGDHRSRHHRAHTAAGRRRRSAHRQSRSRDRVWETSTRRNGRTIGLIDGPASVKIAIPSLPLLEGVYDLTVG